MPAKPTIPRVCRTCGSDFLTDQRQVDLGKAKYCSRACYHAWPVNPIVIDEDGVTARIPLHGHDGEIHSYAVIDAADADWAGQWRWWSDHGYVSRNEKVDGQVVSVRLHRELLGLPWVADDRIGDHEDRDTLNCRRSNLRVATTAQNLQNKSSYRGSTSQHRGVSWNKSQGKWHAQIQVDGRKTHLGNFDSEQDAAQAAADARARLMPYAVD